MRRQKQRVIVFCEWDTVLQGAHMQSVLMQTSVTVYIRYLSQCVCFNSLLFEKISTCFCFQRGHYHQLLPSTASAWSSLRITDATRTFCACSTPLHQDSSVRLASNLGSHARSTSWSSWALSSACTNAVANSPLTCWIHAYSLLVALLIVPVRIHAYLRASN